jgi:DNA-binding SARP family transcriptional activator
VAEVHLAIAFLQCDQGKNEHAASHLQSAFKIAEQKGYEYFYNLGTKYLMKTCLLALDLSVEGVIDYAAHLLLTRPFPMAEKELESLSNHPDRRIREKSWEIRRRIHRSKVPRLSIETLGGFRVFRGDSLIQDEEWDRVQPKQLLKLMITRGSPTIPKETLIEDLWPEERPDAAEKHFKTALQRLRRSLEPVIHKDFGSSYVHLNDNCVILDRDLCVVDAALFLSLIKRGEEKQKSGDIKGALLVYTEAMVLYKGDFLPEEVHLPEADRKREELKGIYIDLLQRLANLHEKQGASRKAIDCHKKAIQADPLLEASYQKLMTLYFNKGMQNEALKLYEACRKLLKTELKTKPDPMTTALYEKILEKINSS